MKPRNGANVMAAKPILIACECSGRVRDAFRNLGYDAWSCDLPGVPYSGQHHITADVFHAITMKPWIAMIAFPPCTYLCSSGLHWVKRDLTGERRRKMEKALNFVKALMDTPIKHKAIENPVGCISTRIRKPDQYIQPYQFGDDASKKTCLWLDNLPKLVPLPDFKQVRPRQIWNGKKFVPRWGNQTDSGQNKLPPSKDRGSLRSITYPGIAQAMAWQWGKYLEKEYDLDIQIRSS